MAIIDTGRETKQIRANSQPLTSAKIREAIKQPWK